MLEGVEGQAAATVGNADPHHHLVARVGVELPDEHACLAAAHVRLDQDKSGGVFAVR